MRDAVILTASHAIQAAGSGMIGAAIAIFFIVSLFRSRKK